MKRLTIRQIPANLSRALRSEARRTGQSLSQTVKNLLARAVGLPPSRSKNVFRRFAGTWTDEDVAEFERATADFERIDPSDWK